MKKRGFSLAELLVAMSIIAVASALLVPAYMNNRPDRYKFRVLNAYKLILETNHSLLSNGDIYYRKVIPENANSTTLSQIINSNTGMLIPNTEYSCVGLACTEKPRDGIFNNSTYSGICKYPRLMGQMLNLTTTTSCTNSNKRLAGTATDTSLWTIEAVGSSASEGFKISIDLNPKNTAEESCPYSSSCKHPDIFRFYVNKNGDIDVTNNNTDNLTKAYIKNMTNIYKEEDYNQAANGG